MQGHPVHRIGQIQMGSEIHSHRRSQSVVSEELFVKQNTRIYTVSLSVCSPPRRLIVTLFFLYFWRNESLPAALLPYLF